MTVLKPKVSILISSHNRLGLIRRTLYAIAKRPPNVPYEVILADDGSTDDIVKELRSFSCAFPWKFIKVDVSEFEQKTGLKKFHNNPCLTNNIAFRHSVGDYVFQQGNEIIAWGDAYNAMLQAAPTGDAWMMMSTTYDIPQKYLDILDPYGSNLTSGIVKMCYQWPLQSVHYHSDVTNYLCLCRRSLFERLKGYDERYFGGISAEDSDLVRRARMLPDFERIVSEAGISLHQYHQGKTTYYDPPASVITPEKWKEGVAINHAIYNAWDGTCENRQTWDWGTFGVKEIISNGYEGDHA